MTDNQLVSMMQNAIADTNNDRTETINRFREELLALRDYDLLRELIGDAELHSAIVRLRAKVIRSASIKQHGVQYRGSSPILHNGV